MLCKVWYKETKKAVDTDSLHTLITKGKRYESFDSFCFEFANAVTRVYSVSIDVHHASLAPSVSFNAVLYCVLVCS